MTGHFCIFTAAKNRGFIFSFLGESDKKSEGRTCQCIRNEEEGAERNFSMLLLKENSFTLSLSLSFSPTLTLSFFLHHLSLFLLFSFTLSRPLSFPPPPLFPPYLRRSFLFIYFNLTIPQFSLCLFIFYIFSLFRSV